MPKQYVMKNKMWDEDKINRLAKQIQRNAENDRDEALTLFKDCKEVMSTLALGGPSVDDFSKLISSCTQALNQMGVANEKLLKLAGLLQKHAFKVMDIEAKSPEGNQLTGSLFDQLKKLNNNPDA